MGDLREADFETAIEQAVRVLDADDARQLLLAMQSQIFANAPRRFVGHADVANLALLLKLGERGQCLGDWHPAITAAGVEAELAEEIGRPLRPIHLIQRSEEHTSDLQSLMRISYAVFCLNKTIQAKR